MFQQRVKVENKLGLHARPASRLVQLAKKFPCDIYVAKDSVRVNAKSIMGVLMLAAGQGTVLSIEADGEQAEDALKQLVGLFKQKFDEE